jgi:hypothetical protein
VAGAASLPAYLTTKREMVTTAAATTACTCTRATAAHVTSVAARLRVVGLFRPTHGCISTTPCRRATPSPWQVVSPLVDFSALPQSSDERQQTLDCSASEHRRGVH